MSYTTLCYFNWLQCQCKSTTFTTKLLHKTAGKPFLKKVFKKCSSTKTLVTQKVGIDPNVNVSQLNWTHFNSFHLICTWSQSLNVHFKTIPSGGQNAVGVKTYLQSKVKSSMKYSKVPQTLQVGFTMGLNALYWVLFWDAPGQTDQIQRI